MAAVDLNYVQFWQPPLKLSSCRTTAKSGTQPMPLYNKTDPTFKRSDQSNSIVAVPLRLDLATESKVDEVGTQGKTQREYSRENLSNILWKSQAALMTPPTPITKQSTTCLLVKKSCIRFCGKRFRQKDTPSNIPRNQLSTQIETIMVYHSLDLRVV
jgi:hypothetical protein